MLDSQFNTNEELEEIPVYDLPMEACSDDGLEALSGDALEALASAGTVPGEPATAKSSGCARRQLEEIKEAKKLQQILSDYAWDESEI